ncbi:MAG: tol-pal system YbgF family protein [Phycisphaerae bacterium]
MGTWRFATAVAGVAAWLSLCAGASAQVAASAPTASSMPASRPAGRLAAIEIPPGRLGELVQTILQTDNAGTAVSAYAKATGIDAHCGALNNAYMRRMLQLGLPRIAAYPAQTLTLDEPRNYLAWAVVGYSAGKRGDWATALAATARALEGIPDDPSLLNNAGQLIAWYDGQKNPSVINDAARRIIGNSLPAWGKSEVFSRAFERVSAAIADRAKEQAAADKKVADAEAVLEASRKKVTELERLLRDVRAEIDAHRDNREQLRSSYNASFWTQTTDGRIVPNPLPDLNYRENLLRAINAEDAKIGSLKTDEDRVIRDGNAALADYKGNLSAVEQLRQKAKLGAPKFAQYFRWDPPAVDGVMTPEADNFPAGVEKRAAVPQDAEAEARQKMDLARLYLANGMNKQAADALQQVVAKYGSTKSAAEAKEMLSRISKD